jgi:hypothetical protein
MRSKIATYDSQSRLVVGEVGNNDLLAADRRIACRTVADVGHGDEVALKHVLAFPLVRKRPKDSRWLRRLAHTQLENRLE